MDIGIDDKTREKIAEGLARLLAQRTEAARFCHAVKLPLAVAGDGHATSMSEGRQLSTFAPPRLVEAVGLASSTLQPTFSAHLHLGAMFFDGRERGCPLLCAALEFAKAQNLSRGEPPNLLRMLRRWRATLRHSEEQLAVWDSTKGATVVIGGRFQRFEIYSP